MKNRDHFYGAEAFHAYYEEIYQERWPALIAALSGSSASLEYDAGGAETYRLDAASVFAAESLSLPAEGEVLDACAAPGGKSIVIASRAAPGLRIIANELSSERRRRLCESLNKCLPPESRARVVVSGEDSGAMCRRNEGRFAAILLDAPCSSERHVLADPKALGEWSPSRPRNLARRQWSLLSSAFLMLRPGGCLVYSTCSINPGENDGVIDRLAAKYEGSFLFDPPLQAKAEKTRHGIIILPDRAEGAGPMYICRLRRRA